MLTQLCLVFFFSVKREEEENNWKFKEMTISQAACPNLHWQIMTRPCPNPQSCHVMTRPCPNPHWNWHSHVTTLSQSPLLPQILSRDSVTVSVDAVVYFNVIDSEQALCSVDDFRWDQEGTVGIRSHMSCVRCHVSGFTCQVAHVRCYVSRVVCHMWHVTCHMSLMPRATAMDLPPANSPNMNRGMLCKDKKGVFWEPTNYPSLDHFTQACLQSSWHFSCLAWGVELNRK